LYIFDIHIFKGKFNTAQPTEGGGNMTYKKPVIDSFTVDDLMKTVCEMRTPCKSCYSTAW